MRKSLVIALCVGLTMAAGTGCKHKKPTPINPDLTSSKPLPPETTTDTTGQPNLDIDQILFSKDNGLVKPIFFDYDSFALRPDALDTLRQNAEALKKYPDAYVQVEGHCDERGTEEYNMALGDKRAQAAREQLVRLGISGDRIITISYGEEDPRDPGHNEAAWSKNRRCEFAQGHKK